MTPSATLIAPSTIRFERLLPGPVDRVWAYLTESKKRATWLAAGEFELRVGGRIELHFDNESLSDEAAPPGAMGAGKHTSTGKITRLEPLRLLAHTWRWDSVETEVSYELAPRGKQVLLTIVHRRLTKPIVAKVLGGWDVHSGILEDILNGVEPRPFWATHDKLAPEYAPLAR